MTIERRFIKEKIVEMDAKQFLRKDLEAAGYSDSLIKRTPMGTHVIIRAMRPGLVIGAGGENVDKLTSNLARLGLENPHIEVQSIENPDIDAKVVSWRIGKLMERGFYFKSVAMRTIDKVMNAGARGVEIRITGKVPSKRARSWCFKSGYIRHCGETVKESVLNGKYTALLKSGTLGIKVRIMPPNIRFPDEVSIAGREEVKPSKVEVVEEEISEKELEKIDRAEPTEDKTLEELAREKGKIKEESKEKVEKPKVKKTTKKKPAAKKKTAKKKVSKK